MVTPARDSNVARTCLLSTIHLWRFQQIIFKYGQNQLSVMIFLIVIFKSKAIIRNQNNHVKADLRMFFAVEIADIQDNFTVLCRQKLVKLLASSYYARQ